MKYVGLFFVVRDKLLLHKVQLEDAEKYGDFLNYPESHFDIWEKNYEKLYHVDFDYFPRGRIVYNTKENTFYIYYDKCLEGKLDELIQDFEGENDFHYQCHKCNKNYIV